MGVPSLPLPLAVMLLACHYCPATAGWPYWGTTQWTTQWTTQLRPRAFCPSSYDEQPGSADGWGSLPRLSNIKSFEECGNLCSQRSGQEGRPHRGRRGERRDRRPAGNGCCGFEYSANNRECHLLEKKCVFDHPLHEDYHSCKKKVFCPFGYEEQPGSVDGWGALPVLSNIRSKEECGTRCSELGWGSCCGFEYSPSDRKCHLLEKNCVFDHPLHEDYHGCKKKAFCPSGYDEQPGSADGWGSLPRLSNIKSFEECGNLCSQRSGQEGRPHRGRRGERRDRRPAGNGCCGFEYSANNRECHLLEKKCVFDHPLHEDYHSCKKKGSTRPPTSTCGNCVFPFTFKGITYQTCTTVGGYRDPWCSTKTDRGGNHIEGGGYYETCTDRSCGI